MDQLPPGQQRAAALGILALLLWIVYLALAEPVWSAFADYDENIDQLQTRLRAYKKNAAELVPLQKQYEQLRRTLPNSQAGYLKGNRASLAAAEMQDLVKRIVAENGGHLTSSQTIPEQKSDKKSGEPDRVTIKVQLSGSIQTVQKVFWTLESGSPTVFLDNVYIRSRTGYLARPGQKAVDQLDIRFDLYGFMKPERT